MSTLFKNGVIYSTSLHKFFKSNIYVSDGIIIDKDYRGDSDGLDVIDCKGLYILPGLVDVHTHGRAGFDFNTADENACRAMRRSYAEAGTTTVMATLASAPMDSLRSSIDAIQKNRDTEEGLATIAGIHLEGRYLNPKKRGAHAADLLSPLDAEELEGLITQMLPLPVHISAACEMENGEKFVKKALSLGATVSLAHSDATYDEACLAVEWGVSGFTHTFNAMKPMHHREPGNAIASLVIDDAYSEIICDGEHLHPAIVQLAGRAKPEGRIVLITDSMEATGCPDGEYSIAGAPVFVKDGRAVNADGALAGSTLNLFDALKNYMKYTGKPLEKALPAVTINPAKMCGINRLCGSITKGFRADFVMIRDPKEPEIESVWVAGKKINTEK